MTLAVTRVLGLFPSLGYLDGIGRSGLAAWSGVGSVPGVEPILVCYGKTSPSFETGGKILHSRSHVGTLLNTMRAGASFQMTLVWHVHLLRLLPFLRGAGKVVVYLHGIEAWRPLPVSVRKQMSRVALVLSNSDYTWNRFLEHNPQFASLPHTTVPLGLDCPVQHQIAAPAVVPMALMIGRITRTEAYKGHDAVVSVWPDVRRRIPGAELHVIGPGDLYDDLRALATRHGVADSCHFHGPIRSQARKEELLVQSRCMALPSRGEGFGLAYIESMRFGRPCLVSNSDAGREVVQPPEAGLAADPQDRQGLVHALCSLLSAGPEWDACASRARARYEAHYTEAAFVARLNAALGLT
ncbi:MAG: glycosyltransferase [Acidobacteriia bacterium]|nr:glycosyltransferase [Terriglobia bacterium]